MRHIIDQDGVKEILSLYDDGKSMTYIANLLNISYYIVKSIIKEYTNHYTETKFISLYIDNAIKKGKRIRKNNKDKIVNQYLNGTSILEIFEINKNDFFSIDDILHVLVEAGININKDEEIQDILRERKREQEIKDRDSFDNKLAIFKDNIKIGDKFLYQDISSFHKKPEKEITVMAKYDRFVKTESECFSYFDLYHYEKLN